MHLPDTNFCFTDNNRAKAVADLFNLTRLLVPDPDNEYGSVAVTHISPTHYILVQKFHGHENPADNGFIAWGWSRKEVGDIEANARVDYVLKHFLPDAITIRDVPWEPPQDPAPGSTPVRGS